MTKTPPNRIITYIMNLWANRVGQLAMLAVALFFFSCQDEASVLGFRNPNSKFKVSYVEIPIESSIYLRDSLRTSNFSYSGEVNRFLVGQYPDAVFGDIGAGAFSQFYTTNFYKLPETAEYDSVILQLRFDLYHYGATSATPQTIGVYELDRPLSSDSIASYFNDSNIPSSTMLGSKTFSINPKDFDDFAASATDADTVITVRLPLDHDFGKRIFDSAIRYRDATTREDSAFVYYKDFVEDFYGIAIRSEVGDKIVGFNPTAAESIISVYFHAADADSLFINLSFSGVIGFNQIKANRSTAELSYVTQPYKEYQPEDNRYIESGIGILTKLDFSKFYEFIDTVPNILINSAELMIESVEASDYTPPAGLIMRVLKDNNRMKKYSPDNPQDVSDYIGYKGYLQFDFATPTTSPIVNDDSVFYANGQTPILGYSSTNNTYASSLTLFFQQLTLPDSKTKFRNFVLYPYSQKATIAKPQSAAKTVNRAIFPKDNIKLKLYYTKPTAPR